MHLGRGDFGTDDLARQYEAVRETFGDPEWAAAQLLGKASLGESLQEGLEEMRRKQIDADKLAFIPVKAGK
jgi:hypothetical protein